jgi:hypothetical protein
VLDGPLALRLAGGDGQARSRLPEYVKDASVHQRHSDHGLLPRVTAVAVNVAVRTPLPPRNDRTK